MAIKEQKIIPKGWQLIKFGDSIIENSKSLFKVRDAMHTGDYPFFTNGQKILQHPNYIIDGENVFMNTGGVAGVKFFNGRASYSTDTYSFKSKDDTKYLYYLLLHNILEINNKFFFGSGLKHLQKDDFKKYRLSFPPIQEQKEIAEILSTIDEEISKTVEIIFKTEKLKKGLMKEVFRNGHMVLLDTVAKRGSGHTPNKKYPEYWNGGIKWVSLADSSKLDNQYIFETDKEISLQGIENSSAVLHTKNTIIVCRDAGIGKTAILGSDNMAVSQHFIAWQCSDDLNFKYLYYWFQSQKNILEQIATGTTIKTIGLSFFKKLRIPLFRIKEQQKIADALSSIDEKISVYTRYKEILSKLKKGLMQDLLSGKVRVN